MIKEIENDVQNKQVHSVITLSVQGAEEDIFKEQGKIGTRIYDKENRNSKRQQRIAT
jgi:hypothetical protein